jgi:hypothetical protein
MRWHGYLCIHGFTRSLQCCLCCRGRKASAMTEQKWWNDETVAVVTGGKHAGCVGWRTCIASCALPQLTRVHVWYRLVAPNAQAAEP